MAQLPASLQTLATELQDRILDFCDWPTLVNILRIGKYWYWLAHPRVADPDTRRRFLYAYERSVENVDWEALPWSAAPTALAFPPEKLYRFGKRLYVCHVCEKLRRPRAFARGQLGGGMGKKRVCLDCGVGGSSPVYFPGSTVVVFSAGLGWRDATLCKQCMVWCQGEYCMKEKRCAQCVEQRSRVGISKSATEFDKPESALKLAALDHCGEWFALPPENHLGRFVKLMASVVSCGGKWFFSRPAYYRKLQIIRDKHPPIQRLSRPPTTVIMQRLVSQSLR